MKFLKVTIHPSKLVHERLINVEQLEGILTQTVNYQGEERIQIEFSYTHNHSITAVLKSFDSNIMGIITEFIENDDTVLDISRYIDTD